MPTIMKDLGFNSPYALAGLCFAVASIAVSTLCDFTIRSAPTNPLGKYVVEDVRGARERPEWMPHDLLLEEDLKVRNFCSPVDGKPIDGHATFKAIIHIE